MSDPQPFTHTLTNDSPGSLRKLSGRGLLLVLELCSKLTIPKRFPLNFFKKSYFLEKSFAICFPALLTVQKMKFSIKDFFSKYDQIRRKLRIWSHLLKKLLMENFIFCEIVNGKLHFFDFRDRHQILFLTHFSPMTHFYSPENVRKPCSLGKPIDSY